MSEHETCLRPAIRALKEAVREQRLMRLIDLAEPQTALQELLKIHMIVDTLTWAERN